MSYKVKSFLYFATFVIVLVTYSTIDKAENNQSTELAHTILSQVSPQEALR